MITIFSLFFHPVCPVRLDRSAVERSQRRRVFTHRFIIQPFDITLLIKRALGPLFSFIVIIVAVTNKGASHWSWETVLICACNPSGSLILFTVFRKACCPHFAALVHQNIPFSTITFNWLAGIFILPLMLVLQTHKHRLARFIPEKSSGYPSLIIWIFCLSDLSLVKRSLPIGSPRFMLVTNFTIFTCCFMAHLLQS